MTEEEKIFRDIIKLIESEKLIIYILSSWYERPNYIACLDQHGEKYMFYDWLTEERLGKKIPKRLFNDISIACSNSVDKLYKTYVGNPSWGEKSDAYAEKGRWLMWIREELIKKRESYDSLFQI